MEEVVLFQELLELNPYETVGKKYQAQYGQPLNYVQFLYMMQRPQSTHTVEQLTAPEAVLLQQGLHRQFREKYSGTLTEDGFIQDGRQMEIEQLLRYIDIPAHKHDFVECAFVLSGTCSHLIGEYPYIHKAGSCAIIPPWVEHHLTPSPDCVCLTVKVRNRAFSRLDIPNLPNFVYPVALQYGQDSFITHTILTMYEQQERGKIYHEQVIELLFRAMLVYITQNYRDTFQYLVTRAVHSRRTMDILNYAFENYQSITLNALADHFHFSSAYLSNFIRQQTGETFSYLLKEFKLKQAARLLAETKLQLNDICGQIGYSDTSQFISSFKEMYGITPLKYRRQHDQP